MKKGTGVLVVYSMQYCDLYFFWIAFAYAKKKKIKSEPWKGIRNGTFSAVKLSKMHRRGQNVPTSYT